jgi:phosphoribosyl 1,2-cyclic phosphodiesterase/GAF domain-containing protein
VILRFWGTRGSIAKPGPTTVRHGGNTSCVELRSDAGTLVVLDCGTGAHGLGQALVAGGQARRGHILITHTHWDHIQGLPFFAPLFAAGNEWDIYAPRGIAEELRDTLAGQMQYAYFPVSLDQLRATVRYHDLLEGDFVVGDVRVRARYLNHPALTLGYRIETDGVSVVYATDHEPHSRARAVPTPQEAGQSPVASPEDDQHAEFLTRADLVIHDCQYTAAEYAARVGWGHGTVEYAVELALAARVRRLALFHHDPLRDDDAVDALVRAARERVLAAGADLDVVAASEGRWFELRDSAASATPGAMRPQALEPRAAGADAAPQRVLVALVDRDQAARLGEALRADGLRILETEDAESALRAARTERLALAILDRELPGGGGVALCRVLRADPDPAVRDLPVVIAAADEDGDGAAAAEAGVTDWLVRPFSAEYARTKTRAWLLRTSARWVRAVAPADEERRLASLQRMKILDTPPEAGFDRVTRLARRLFRVPIALVSLVDQDRQWFKSRQGLAATQTPRDVSFCAHAILADEPLVVPDARLDPRFADNPLVTGDPHIRFYAGQPLRAPDGSRIGTLCIIDRRPRRMEAGEREALRDLSALVEAELRAERVP